MLTHTAHEERIAVHRGTGVVEYDFYRHEALTVGGDSLVVLLPGWLGSNTLKRVAQRLAGAGHDVVLPVHNPHYHLLAAMRADQNRAQRTHIAASDAVQKTGAEKIVIIDHSNGNQDAFRVAGHVARNGAGYEISAIAAVAGVGLNGHTITPLDMIREARDHLNHLRAHPNNELTTLGLSVLNFARNPVVAIAEGLGAALIDQRQTAAELLHSGVVGSLVEAYFIDDSLVPPPQDRSDFLLLEGSHLTPILEPEVVVRIAERIAT